MTNILLVGGTDEDNGDYSLLAKVAQSATRTLDSWSTLKTAKTGDRVWFYIPAPQSAVVAAGVALSDAVPGDDWPYVMPVGELEWLSRPVPLQELRERFPSWTWAKKARGRTTLPDDVADYLARSAVVPELELMGTLEAEVESEQQVAEAELVLARVLPDAKDRSLVLKRLLDSATVADTTAPNAWGVTLFSDGFRLNVGQVEVLVLGEQTLRVNLLTDLGVPPADGPCFEATTYRSMPEPQCAFVGTVQEYAGVEAAIAAAHGAFVRRAVSTRCLETVPILPRTGCQRRFPKERIERGKVCRLQSTGTSAMRPLARPASDTLGQFAKYAESISPLSTDQSLLDLFTSIICNHSRKLRSSMNST